MAATEKRLHVLLNRTPMGLLLRQTGGRLSFRYDPEFLADEDAIPLSLSMPLEEKPYGHAIINPWIWGLLPDNERILERWARRFQVSPTDCFGLLENMGEDCAGAIRFVHPENLAKAAEGGRSPIDEQEIERRLNALRREPSMGREPGDRGQFSLAGAQSKTALHYAEGEWFIPWGRAPTTHILKPPRLDMAGHVENEHFCLRLAECLGLSVAKSEIRRFGRETAIVVERYDRLRLAGETIRVHQEDACQALAIHPSQKYEADGGPGVADLLRLLNRSSRQLEDRRRAMESIIFNYLILGTDAHAKNYSLLLGRDRQVRLAPLYDIASLLPYAKTRRECRFAMKIGGHYRDDQIQPRHFEKLARACEFPSATVLERVLEFSARIPPATQEILSEMADQGVRHPTLDLLPKTLTKRADTIAQDFSRSNC